jgi:hypothetical protein
MEVVLWAALSNLGPEQRLAGCSVPRSGNLYYLIGAKLIGLKAFWPRLSVKLRVVNDAGRPRACEHLTGNEGGENQAVDLRIAFLMYAEPSTGGGHRTP